MEFHFTLFPPVIYKLCDKICYHGLLWIYVTDSDSKTNKRSTIWLSTVNTVGSYTLYSLAIAHLQLVIVQCITLIC